MGSNVNRESLCGVGGATKRLSGREGRLASLVMGPDWIEMTPDGLRLAGRLGRGVNEAHALRFHSMSAQSPLLGIQGPANVVIQPESRSRCSGSSD